MRPLCHILNVSQLSLEHLRVCSESVQQAGWVNVESPGTLQVNSPEDLVHITTTTSLQRGCTRGPYVYTSQHMRHPVPEVMLAQYISLLMFTIADDQNEI